MIIYKTTNIINGKIYIGQSTKNDPDYFGSGLAITRAIKKYGKVHFTREILSETNDYELLQYLEMFWIIIYDSNNRNVGYNIRCGGSQSKHSESTKEKMKISSKIRWSKKEEREKLSIARKSIKCKPHSTETKNKIRKAHQGRKRKPFSDEHKKKIGESIRGMKRSDMTKMKISESHRGNKNPMFGKSGNKNPMFGKGYLLSGNKNGCYGKTFVWMNNGIKNKRVDKNDVEYYLQSGWTCGFIRYKKTELK